MKKILPILVYTFLALNICAQSPEKMSYQAIIRDSDNQLVTNQSVGMQISILQGTVTGTAAYVETQTPTTNANGLVTIEIGAGITSDNFSEIDWTNGPYYIQIETDPEGGTSYSITGTSQVLSVPYAMHAKTAESITGGFIETDPMFSEWDKSDGISITENQISNLGNYIETETQTISDVAALGNLVNAQLKNVSDPTDNQDAVTKAYLDSVLANIVLEIQAELGLTDIDGNLYKAVLIGDQIWMAENLKTTKYNDGTDIPLVTDNEVWAYLTTPAYCWYNDDEATYKDDYGALYNWYTVEQGNVCPSGWHIPSVSDWEQLKSYLINNGFTYDGSTGLSANKIAKAMGSLYNWDSSTTEGAIGNTDYPEYRNKSGFAAMPGGWRTIHFGGGFGAIGQYGTWWTSEELHTTSAYIYQLSYDLPSLQGDGGFDKSHGLSVRCIKD